MSFFLDKNEGPAGPLSWVFEKDGQLTSCQTREDGSAEVSVTVRKSAQFFGWVAGMNGAVTVAGPKSLVDEYRAWLQDLAARV